MDYELQLQQTMKIVCFQCFMTAVWKLHNCRRLAWSAAFKSERVQE